MTGEPVIAGAIVEVAPDPEALARRVAEWLVERVTGKEGPFALTLSGGSTPERLYQILAAPAFRERIDWSRMHLFWGDERYVPHDHPDSNYRMAHEAFIDHVAIPPGQVHPIPTGPSPAAAAAAYEETLKDFYGAATLDSSRSIFDVTLLGLGPDGHTASLFPGDAALAERRAWVEPVVGARPEPRITLTLPVLAASDTVAYLVTGAEKRPVIERLRAGDTELPAARVRAARELRWFLDRDAAGEG
jgi:6-phosphogluconolactonase